MAAAFTPVEADEQTGVGQLWGWQFAENGAEAGAEARVLLRAGGAGGAILADIRLAAKQSVGENYAEPIDVPDGVYVDVTVGAVRGAVYGG